MKSDEDGIPYRQVAALRRSVDLPRLSVVETVHRPGGRTGLHEHGRPRLCLVVAGGFEELLGTESEDRGFGSLIFYPADAAHENRFHASGARCLNVELTSAAGIPSVTRRLQVLEFGVPEIGAAYRLYDALVTGQRGRSLQRRAVDLVRLLQIGPAEGKEPARGPAERARSLVRARAREGISLSRVARELDTDPYALARAFRRRFGCSVGEYRHRVRVRRARAELLATDAPLDAIAYRLGFADQSHFTRIFKRLTGLPPGRYRRAGS